MPEIGWLSISWQENHSVFVFIEVYSCCVMVWQKLTFCSLNIV